MGLERYIEADAVIPRASARTKWELLERLTRAAMAHPMFRRFPEVTLELARAAVVEREKERPTGLGEGFAFPHARLPAIQRAALAVALLEEPVDFGAPDGAPAWCVCLMLVPEAQPTIALKLMSEFAKLAQTPGIRESLSALPDGASVRAYLVERMTGLDQPVLARDIMRASVARIHPDMPLREVTRVMMTHRLEAIAVTDDEGAIVGEITCDQLFKAGMPEFFTQLRTIAFIREFDPFEHYFAIDRHKTARDLMSPDFAVVEEDATLLEVVFALAVRKYPKVYVICDGKRIGVIDRPRVLDQVLNL